MQRLEVSGAVRPIYGSLGFKRLIKQNRHWLLTNIERSFRTAVLKQQLPLTVYIKVIVFVAS